jgi:hypothetical protein
VGESRQSGESEGRINATGAVRVAGAIRITELESGIALYFPPLRAAGSALMLALFGAACSIIGLAAISGLVRSGESAMLALAFAGVFALPLFALGQLFIAIALWTAANSLRVEVSENGITVVRSWLGYTISRRNVPRATITAIESRFAAKYVGAFGATRYFRLFARATNVPRPLLIADSLKGRDMTEDIRQLIIRHLALPELATTGAQAHIPDEEAA